MVQPGSWSLPSCSGFLRDEKIAEKPAGPAFHQAGGPVDQSYFNTACRFASFAG